MTTKNTETIVLPTPTVNVFEELANVQAVWAQAFKRLTQGE